MKDGQQADAASMLASIGRHWGWIMAFGVLWFLAGVAVLAWPGRTLVVIAVLFGVQLIVTGIFRFVAAFAADDLTGGARVLLAVLGVLSLIIGLYAVRHVLVTLLALALLLGIFWIVKRIRRTVHGPVPPGDGEPRLVGRDGHLQHLLPASSSWRIPAYRCWCWRSCSASGSFSTASWRSPWRSGYRSVGHQAAIHAVHAA